MTVEAPFRIHVAVAGMTCQHCVMSVTEEVSEIAGVTGVDVVLGTGTDGNPGDSTVTVRSDREIARDEIAAAVTVAGFALAE